MKMTFLGSLGMIQIWHALWNFSFPRQKSTELTSFTGTEMFRKKSKNIKSKPFLVQNSKRIIYSQPKIKSLNTYNNT